MTATFADLLLTRLRMDGSRPVVTFYDDRTGERVELSVATYSNWVAKTAGLLQDELDIERGARVLVDLPTHWLGPVWLGALWSVGACVVAPGPDGSAPGAPGAPDGPVDLVVSGPERLDAHARGDAPVVGLSLLPMGARFAEPVPAGVVDYGAVVWGQPDAFVAYDPPGSEDPAWSDGPRTLSQADLVALGDVTGRVLTDHDPVTETGLGLLIGPLASGQGTVWVRHGAPGSWPERAAAEHATAVLRSVE